MAVWGIGAYYKGSNPKIGVETFKNVLSTDQGTDICKRRSSLEDRRLFYKDYFRFYCHDFIKKVVGLLNRICPFTFGKANISPTLAHSTANIAENTSQNNMQILRYLSAKPTPYFLPFTYYLLPSKNPVTFFEVRVKR